MTYVCFTWICIKTKTKTKPTEFRYGKASYLCTTLPSPTFPGRRPATCSTGRWAARKKLPLFEKTKIKFPPFHLNSPLAPAPLCPPTRQGPPAWQSTCCPSTWRWSPVFGEKIIITVYFLQIFGEIWFFFLASSLFTVTSAPGEAAAGAVSKSGGWKAFPGRTHWVCSTHSPKEEKSPTPSPSLSLCLGILQIDQKYYSEKAKKKRFFILFQRLALRAMTW